MASATHLRDPLLDFSSRPGSSVSDTAPEAALPLPLPPLHRHHHHYQQPPVSHHHVSPTTTAATAGSYYCSSSSPSPGRSASHSDREHNSPVSRPKKSVSPPQPQQQQQQQQQQRRQANAQEKPSAKFAFINIAHPTESKRSDIMTQVRRRAMQSTLEAKEPKSTEKSQSSEPGAGPLVSRSRPPAAKQSFRSNARQQQDRQPSTASSRKKRATDRLVIPTDEVIREPQALPDSASSTSSNGVLAESQGARNSAGSRRSSRDNYKDGKSLSPQDDEDEDTPHLYHPPLPTRDFELDPFASTPPPQNPNITTMKLKKNFVTFFGSDGLIVCWGPIAAVDPLFYLSSLCISARHEDTLMRRHNNPHTIALEIEVVNRVREALANPLTMSADTTIAAILFIACANNYAIKEQAGSVQWYDLVLKLVMMRGGLESLRPNEPALAILILINALCSPLLREDSPRPEFILAGKIMLSKLDMFGLPIMFESPICYPRVKYQHLPHSKQCSATLLSLLEQMRHVSELFVYDGPTEYQPRQYVWQKEHIAEQIHSYPAASVPGLETTFDFVYESCRIAALIQEFSLSQKLSYAEVGKCTDYVDQLMAALKKTRIEDIWGDMRGVLLWVLLVGACAATHHPNRQWMVATMVRVNMKISFEHGDHVLRGVYKMLQLQNFNVFSAMPEPLLMSNEPQSV